jgi:hypothetical protein
MPRTIIIVADAARARLLTYDPDPSADHTMAPVLTERTDLVNPERRLRASQVYSDTRPGTAYAPTGLGFGLDDHRDRLTRETLPQLHHHLATLGLIPRRERAGQ